MSNEGDVLDGKYLIDRRIAVGGMGEVFAGRHMHLATPVAIKVLRADIREIPNAYERFLREARAASRLRSDHVGKVIDFGELATGEPYMVMELIDGVDLGQVVAHGSMRPPIAVGYILQACEALAEAHALGMVHRDIKPANLMLTQREGEPWIKLLDFGIATVATGEVDGRLTQNEPLGSPAYMSPEQHRSPRDVDARTDIWSLGVTLYELLSGSAPFQADTYAGLAVQVVTRPHPVLLGVLPNLMRVIDRCLEKEPADRFANIAELAIALAPFAVGGVHKAARVKRITSEYEARTL